MRLPVSARKIAFTAIVVTVVYSFFIYFSKRPVDDSGQGYSDTIVSEEAGYNYEKNEVHIENSQKKDQTSDLNYDQIKAEATDFHNFIFPSLTDLSAATEATPLAPVHLLSYVPDGVEKVIVPFSHSGVVISLSYMRRDHSEEFIPGQLVDVSNQEWDRYPPISRPEAEHLLRSQHRTYAYEHVPGFYHLGNISPHYKFRSMGEEDIFFLVNAVSGVVEMVPSPEVIGTQLEKNSEASMPPILLSDEGLIEINYETAEGMSEQELATLKEEVAQTNVAIKEGTLKIGPGPDFEVIYDHRGDK